MNRQLQHLLKSSSGHDCPLNATLSPLVWAPTSAGLLVAALVVLVAGVWAALPLVVVAVVVPQWVRLALVVRGRGTTYAQCGCRVCVKILAPWTGTGAQVDTDELLASLVRRHGKRHAAPGWFVVDLTKPRWHGDFGEIALPGPAWARDVARAVGRDRLAVDGRTAEVLSRLCVDREVVVVGPLDEVVATAAVQFAEHLPLDAAVVAATAAVAPTG